MRHLVRVLTLSSLLVTYSANGSEYFTDDFSDGDPYDGSPVEWLKGGAYSGGTRDATDGDWEWTPSGAPMASWVSNAYSDVSIHTQVRLLEANKGFNFTGIFARNEGYDGYNAGLMPPSQIVIAKGINGQWTRWTERVPELEMIDNDIHIQFDLFGSTLSLTVWPDGDTKPAPQMTLEDDSLLSGVVGLSHNPGSTNEAAVWQLFETHPEPFTPAPTGLVPGDANQDLVFNQMDLVQVLQANKYLTDSPATWGEGDWDGGPGGEPGNPPVGDGRFNQFDILAALAGGYYEASSYGAITSDHLFVEEPTFNVFGSDFHELASSAAVGGSVVDRMFPVMSGLGVATPCQAELVPVPEPSTAMLAILGITLSLTSFRLHRRSAGKGERRS